MRKQLVVGAASLLLLFGCTSGDDEGASSSASASTAEESAATGPAPGVTDDTIKVGVTYVDLAAIREVTDLDHGDYEKAYQALFDKINDDGGIHGRMIEAVFAPVNPIGTQPSEEACVKLTQDEEVFVTLGFFQSDAVLCHVETQESAVVGGTMTDDRLARAKAPWFTFGAGGDFEADAIRTFAEEGVLDGKLALVGNTTEQGIVDTAEELLAELDIEPVATAVIDAPPDDVTAQNAAVGVIAERFRSADADKVLVVGTAGITWANGLEQTDYRPQMILSGGTDSIAAYAEDTAARDLSVLEDAVVAGLYGPAQDSFEEESMQDCIAVQEAAGLTVVAPDDVEDGDTTQYVSSFNACRTVELFRLIADAAGEDLNYGSFRQAGEELGEVNLPGFPDPMTYGAPPSADGDGRIYQFAWDTQEEEFVRQD